MGVTTACNYRDVFVSLTFRRARDRVRSSLHTAVSFLLWLLLLTSTQVPSESDAGEVVTLAVFSVHETEAGRVARALAAKALALPAAHLCTIMGPVQGCTHSMTNR